MQHKISTYKYSIWICLLVCLKERLSKKKGANKKMGEKKKGI